MSIDPSVLEVRSNLLRALDLFPRDASPGAETLIITVYDLTNRVVYSRSSQLPVAAPLQFDFASSFVRSFRFSVTYISLDYRLRPWRFTRRLRLSYIAQHGRVRSVAGDENPLPSFLALARTSVGRRRKAFYFRPLKTFAAPRPNEGTTAQYKSYWKEGNILRYDTYVPYTSFTRNWTGVRTPNYGALKKKGKLPINNHSVSIYEVNGNSEYFSDKEISSGTVLNVKTGPFPISAGLLVEPVYSDQACSRAIKRLIERANGDIKANIAQDVAQIGQVLSLITTSAKRITGSITALKKGNLPGAVEALWRPDTKHFRGRGPQHTKTLANNWLELQYGWKPLLSDIHGAMEALALYFSSADTTAVRQVTGSATVRSKEYYPIYSGDANPTFLGRIEVNYLSTCRYGIRFKVADPLKNFLAQTGFLNPINLGWELLPFSFVLDWFLPIGPWLETLSSWSGLEFKDGYHTRFLRQNIFGDEKFSGVLNIHAGGDRHTEYIGLYTRNWVKLSRVALTGFPSSVLPSLKNGVSLTHTANALALMKGAFRFH